MEYILGKNEVTVKSGDNNLILVISQKDSPRTTICNVKNPQSNLTLEQIEEWINVLTMTRTQLQDNNNG